MLSDGVFAIAITLSAIEIKPEAVPGKTLWEVWATPLLIYFLSFFLIGTVWAFHRRIVAHLRDIDPVGTAINLLLLSLVALMPVVIRFVFEGFQQGQGLLVYGIALGATYACMAVLWLHVAFFARLAPDLPHRLVPGTGHWIHMDRPAQFNRLLDDFLRECSRSAPARASHPSAG